MKIHEERSKNLIWNRHLRSMSINYQVKNENNEENKYSHTTFTRFHRKIRLSEKTENNRWLRNFINRNGSKKSHNINCYKESFILSTWVPAEKTARKFLDNFCKVLVSVVLLRKWFLRKYKNSFWKSVSMKHLRWGCLW